jgi:hypothetical protein
MDLLNWKKQFDAIHPAVYVELHKQHYVFRLTQPLFVIIFSNTTCFDQADHHRHQVFVLYKDKTQGKNVNFCDNSPIM